MSTPTPPVNPANPANATAAPVAERRRIPMSIPQRKLEVPDMPGWSLHWFVESNVPRALQAGYEFVDDKDVNLNQHGVGNSSLLTGNQDLGSRVRVVAGEGRDGKGEYLVLMRIKEEWFQEDQRAIAERNASVLQQIFRGERILSEGGESKSDRSLRYVDEKRTSLLTSPKPLFQRPTRKAR